MGVTYNSRIKKWKVCRVNGRTHHPYEELVTGLSLYEAEVEASWRRKYPLAVEGAGYIAIFPNRAKVYRKEAP